MPKTLLTMGICKDNTNTINKVINNQKSVPVIIKNFADIDNFECIIKNTVDTDFSTFNYVIINSFAGIERACYFITGRELREHDTISLKLKLDNLETYKTDILNSYGIITRESINADNKMYADSFEGNLLSNFNIEKHKFPKQLDESETVKILVTVGGV